ncbi:MAG: hypothetical protein WCJ75_16410 [Desulfomonile sp.]
MDEAAAIDLISQSDSIEELARLWNGNISQWKDQFDYAHLARLVGIKNAKKRNLAGTNPRDGEGFVTGEVEQSSAPVRNWSEIGPIEMVPIGRRTEIKQIINRNPDLVRILESCKAGLFDCWTAMEIFGLPDEFNPRHQGNGH